MKPIFITILFCISFILHSQTGIQVPQMTSCDNMVKSFLSNYNIPGASFALAKNGKLVYMRSFGNTNLEKTELTQPHHLFRIASISKSLTSIAIFKMVEAGTIKLSDKVFGNLGLLKNHPSFSNAIISDPRIYDITVQHLLEHSAGWNRDIDCFPNPTFPYPYFFSGCDPIVAPLYVTNIFNAPNPVSEETLIKYLLYKGLNYKPGSSYNYSNIAYLILGEIIEQKSGLSYENYVKLTILNPLGICDMNLGKNLKEDKFERESEYFGNGYTTLSSYNTGKYVPWEYGGFNLEAMDAHGGWIASAKDLVKLLVAVDGFSSKPDILSSITISSMTSPSLNNTNYAKGWSVNSNNNWWHTGSLDGTASFFARTANGYTWAILLNKRIIGDNQNSFWNDFDNLPWNCISSTNSWPAHDLMMTPTQGSTNPVVTSISSSSVTLKWNKGDGNKRILVIKNGSSIDRFPLDGLSYAGNSIYGSGSNLGNNNYVVYNNSLDNVTISNLSPSQKYFIRIFEYNENQVTGNYPLYQLCNCGIATFETPSECIIPQVVANNQTICAGQVATLIASGAESYFWSNGATGNSIDVSPIVTTSYTVSGTTGSCSSLPVTVQVIVNNIPVVSVTGDTICKGESVVLTASGASTYIWSNGASGINISVNPASSTNYSVVGNTLGCLSEPATANVIVYAAPNDSLVVLGSTLKAFESNINYQWIDCNNHLPILNQTNQSFTPGFSGSYALIVSNQNCRDTSKCIQLIISKTEDVENEIVKTIFPNPTNGSLTLVFSEKFKSGTIEVVSLNKKVLLNKFISNQDKVILDLSELLNGIYSIRININNTDYFFKFIKI